MFTIKNLRKEKHGKWTRLVVDLEVTGIDNPFEEKTIWFALENKNADMFSDDVYDAFAPFILYLGMHYHQDIHIKGNISPILYHNLMHYVAKIFDGFSVYTKIVDFKVDGLRKPKSGPMDLVATGISCGVDSLTTIYDNFVQSTYEDLRINSLFLVNSGTHGEYEDNKTREIWLKRAKLNQKAADDLGLPVFLLDSNLHYFTFKVGQNRLGYLAIYCCFMSVQRYVKRYLVASSSSYDDNLKHALSERDVDMAGYCEIFMPHLLSTGRIELVIDGCQYTRAEKIERIKDWEIAHKYLNVCLSPFDDGSNCSSCSKCVRTLLVLDTMGKLDEFADVFDKNVYRKNKNFYKSYFSVSDDIQSDALVRYLKNHGMNMPTRFLAHCEFFLYRAIRKAKKVLNINGT